MWVLLSGFGHLMGPKYWSFCKKKPNWGLVIQKFGETDFEGVVHIVITLGFTHLFYFVFAIMWEKIQDHRRMYFSRLSPLTIFRKKNGLLGRATIPGSLQLQVKWKRALSLHTLYLSHLFLAECSGKKSFDAVESWRLFSSFCCLRLVYWFRHWELASFFISDYQKIII